MSESLRRRRDPQARRRKIVHAAAELIVEVGVDAVTHRLVAARADVPLGATTQYFATLDDLRDAALQELTDEMQARVDATREAVTAEGVSASALAALVHAELEDVRALQADRAVVTAAVHDPRLRELARRWSEEVVGFIAPVHGTDRARAAAVFIDGLLWHAQIHREPLDLPIIEASLAAIFGIPDNAVASTSTTGPARDN